MRRGPRTGACGDVLVLGYHRIATSRPSRLAVLSSSLRWQLDGLVARGFCGATFGEAVASRHVRDTLAVTFDDGERSVLEHALPILSGLGLVGTVFAPVATVGGPGMLSWDDLRELANAGWEIGSHTNSHAYLPELDERSLDDELRGSRETIEDRVGHPCLSIAYPYGAANVRVRSAAERAGFTAGCGDATRRAGDPLWWPRVGVHGSDGRIVFRAKTARAGRRLRVSRVGSVLAGAGRTVRNRSRDDYDGLRHT